MLCMPLSVVHAQSTAPATPNTPASPAASSAAPSNATPAKPDEKATALRAAYDAAFRATMDKPQDPAVLLKFAEIAVELGDLEGAISVLERLLLIDGDQPEVKLELGVLYFRLGSTEVARSYLEAARDSESADDDIRKRATTFLQEGVKP
jgi:tetratricopeptide (TPR) repeat protein